MNETKVFTQGGLNYDTAPHLVPATDWIDAEHLRIAASDEQYEGAAVNIEGNTRIGNYVYAAGQNICIGTFRDELRNVVYAMICNEHNYDEIVQIDPATNTIVPVFRNLVWTSGVDVTQFEPQNKIHSINVIHRAVDEGDLLFWTDGATRPRKINILKGVTFGTGTGYPSPILADYTYVAKQPPRSAIISYQNDLDRPTNNLKGKLFQFQVRYVYDDYEKSVWSNWSNFAIPVQPFLTDRDSDPTINNYIQIVLTTGEALVTKIELGVRQNIEGVWGDLYLAETFDKQQLSIGDNTTYTYSFYNDTGGGLQTPADTTQVWDFVPTTAGCQDLVSGNTLAYGDVTEGLQFTDTLSVLLTSYESQLLTLNEGDNVLGYKFSGKYRFGLIYFDEFNRTDGVHSNQPITPTRSFEVNTTYYLGNTNSSDSYDVFAPVINAAIFHQPPVWAKTFKWVRTNCLTYSKYFMYAQYFHSGDIDYLYMDIDILTESLVKEGQYALSYEFTPGDRIRLVRRMGYGSGITNLNVDLEVFGVVKDPVVGAVTISGNQLKIIRNTQAKEPPFYNGNFYLFELYSPSSITNNEFYYEFDKEYLILNPGQSNRYHAGQLQDQTPTQPATFSFFNNGDVYYRKRQRMDARFPPEQTAVFQNIPIIDVNYSDKFHSAVNGSGRGFIVDTNAKEQRLISTIRYGGAYVQDTFINKTNNFPAANIIDNCDRSFGIIKRLVTRDRQLRVYQELKCGWIPVKSQVLQTAGGNNIVSQSDQLLNNIQYYEGDFGIGNAPCSLSSENFADYFHDTNRGVICRLSRDGLTPISIVAKINRFAILEDVKYKTSDYPTTGIVPPFVSDIPGWAQIYGAFDTKSNTYISAYSEIATYQNTGSAAFVRTLVNPAKVMVWNEVRNRFITKYLFSPEWMTSLKNDLITFKNGLPYTHNDKDNRCSFYGVNFNWSITLPFNDKFAIKKTFISIDILSNEVLEVPEITTSLGSQSNLIASDFARLEEHYHASFLRDANSPGGVIEGDTLKGAYILCKIQKTAAQELVVLNSAAVESIVSQRNSK
jgi:hypothetical protein